MLLADTGTLLLWQWFPPPWPVSSRRAPSSRASRARRPLTFTGSLTMEVTFNFGCCSSLTSLCPSNVIPAPPLPRRARSFPTVSGHSRHPVSIVLVSPQGCCHHLCHWVFWGQVSRCSSPTSWGVRSGGESAKSVCLLVGRSTGWKRKGRCKCPAAPRSHHCCSVGGWQELLYPRNSLAFVVTAAVGCDPAALP